MANAAIPIVNTKKKNFSIVIVTFTDYLVDCIIDVSFVILIVVFDNDVR